MHIYEPSEAAIDWQAFRDCVVSTHWSGPADLYRFLKGGKVTAYNAWHGRPIGLLPFLRICKAMRIDPIQFLLER